MLDPIPHAFTRPHWHRIIPSLLAIALISSAARAATFSWSNPGTSGSWSGTSDWTPTPGAGGPGANDTANLVDTGGTNRVVTYDTAASGTIGTVNFTQLSSATNTLLLNGGRNFVDLAPLTLGGSNQGVSELRLISNGLSLTGSATSLQINSGGLLTLSPGSSNSSPSQFYGPVTLSGGTISVIQGASGSAAQESLAGPLTMTSGTIAFAGTGSTDTRLQVQGNFNGTGGLIMYNGSGSNNLESLVLAGPANILNGALLDTHVQIMIEGTANQNLSVTTGTLNTLLIRNGHSATVSSSVPGPNVGELIWAWSASSGTTDLILGSNLTLTQGSGLPIAGYGTASNYIQGCTFDADGYTLDLTGNTAAWAPTYDVVVGSGTNWDSWNLQTSAPGGVIKASGFDFHSAYHVTVGPGLTLQATGASTTINLSGSTSFDPASTLLYTGLTNSTLTATGVTLGNVMVDSGTLTLGSNVTTGSGSQVTVNAGGALALGNDILNVSDGNFTLNAGGTLAVNVSGTASGQYGQLAVSGTISLGGTLLISATSSFPAGASITVLANSGAATVQGTFNGLPEGSVFGAGGNLWTITYAGGTGASVVITAGSSFIAQVSATAPAQAVPRGFAGFSLETSSISAWSGTAPPGAFNFGLANFMTQLGRLEGPPVVRLGGNSQDETWYQATPSESAPTFDYNVAPSSLIALQPSNLQSLAWLWWETGCDFTIGLNFGGDNPSAAVQEMAGALSIFPAGSIIAFDVGNEPDLYTGGYRNSSWNSAAYQTDVSSFISQLRASYSTVPLAAPAYFGASWLPTAETASFNNLLGAIENQISFVTVHHYSFSGKSPPANAATVLLSSTYTSAIGPLYTPTIQAAASDSLLVRVNETNSAYQGGDPGVSNAMAGGLWIANILGVYAQAGFIGANFHGGSSGAYTPFNITTSGSTFSTSATPVYYGMFLFSQFIQNNAGLLPVTTSSSSGTLACYASRDSGGSVRILVINKDGVNTLSGNLVVTNTSGYNSFGTLGILETSQSPPLSASNGLTIDGQSFDTNGNLTGSALLSTLPGTPFGTAAATYLVTLPPASAAIFTLDRATPVGPTVTLDKTSQSVIAGSPVEFTATPAGAAPFTCQWFENGAPIAGGTNPRLFLPSPGPANSGTYTVLVGNPAGSITGTANLTVQPTYTYWQDTYFTASQLQNPAISGDTASPAQDGIPNLVKYALNLNPWTNGQSGLPAQSIAATGGNNYLALTYTQLLSPTDLTYTVQVSTDLMTWNSGPAYTTQSSAINNPNGFTETVTTESLLPLTGTTPRQFIRLQITGP